MLPPNSDKDTLAEALKGKQEEGTHMVSLSIKCNWDEWIFNILKQLLKKGEKS